MDIQEHKLQLVPTSNGEITAIFLRQDGRELYLHSRFNPSKEARSLVSKIPLREDTLYVILGGGFGYHIKELLNKLPQSSRIIVVESSAVPLGAAMQKYYHQQGKAWIRDKRLIFTTMDNSNILTYYLSELFIQHHLFYLEMFTHIPSATTDEKFYRSVTQSISSDFPSNLKISLATTEPILKTNLINYWDNLETTWKNPSIEKLFGQWTDKPAIVVSAGPSLNAQLDQLRQIQGKVLIICVGTAAKVLINHGITPDFVIVVDPNETSMVQFIGWDTEKTTLLYYQKAWRGIPAAHQGLKFWFTLLNDLPIPAHESTCKFPFSGGGTVAFSALQFARYVKSDPIILVGQDFAFLDGATHATGTDHNYSFNQEILPEGFFRVPGTNEDMVVTNNIYYSYLKFMQEYILKNQDTRYINTSETGAKIEGTQAMSLEKAVNLYSNSPMNATEKIKQIWNQYQFKGQGNTASLLHTWNKELRHFLVATENIIDFDLLVTKFKNLQIYKLNYIHFDALFYTAEMNEKWFSTSSRSDLVSSLKTHVEAISQKIIQMQDRG